MASEPTPEYLKLVSNDDYEFVVKRSAALISPVLRSMLDPKNLFKEAKENRVVFDSISGVVLEKVCEYLYYSEKNRNNPNVQDMDIEPELCLELLMAADYLNI